MAQNALGKFEVHHQTYIEFPCVELFSLAGHEDEEDEDSEVFVLLDIDRQSERFEPIPLIQDAAVEAHAHRCSAEENAFFSLTPARVCGDDEVPDDEFGIYDEMALADDMDLIGGLCGETRLKMCTYEMRGSSHTSIRIERLSCIRTRNGKVWQSAGYESLLQDFDALQRWDQL